MLQLLRAHTEIVLLSLSMGLSIAVPSLMPVTIGIGAVFALWRIVTTHQFAPRIPLELPLALFLTLASLNLLFVTPDRAPSIPAYLQLIASVLLFFAIINWANTTNRLLITFVVFSLLGVLFAAVFPLLASGPVPVIGRFLPSIQALLPIDLSGTINSNILGGLLTLILPLPIAWMLFFNKKFLQLLGLLCALFIGGMLVLTQSRGGLLATIVTVIILFSLRFALLRYAIPLILVGIGAFIALVPTGAEFLVSWFDVNSSAATTLSGRLEIYSRAIYLLQDFPFTGVGMSIFGKVLDLLYPLFTIAPGRIEHAHNIFLQVGSELGLPALICWIAIELIVIFSAAHAYRHTSDLKLRGVSAAALTAQISFLLHGITDAPLWNTRPAPFVWGIWGMAIASFLVTYSQGATDQLATEPT